jgi:chitodextrinase
MFKVVLWVKSYVHKQKIIAGTMILGILAAGLLALFTNAIGVAARTSPPTTPTGLKATVVSPVQINLSWKASTSQVGVAGYDIYSSGTLIGSSATTGYAATGLTPKTKYKFTVAAYDTQGKLSSKSSAVTAITPTDTTPPTKPGSLTVSNLISTSLTLNWTASTDNVGVVGYKVLRNGTQIATTTATTYADSSLTNNTTYNYSVEAYDAANLVSAAATVSATTVLPAPANLQTSNVTATSVGLSWTQTVADPKITGYQVSRSGVVLAKITGTTYTDITVSAGQAYGYSIAAYNAAGNLSSAVTINVTTPNPSPNAPTGVTAVTSSTAAIGLKWTAPTGGAAPASYTVYRNGTAAGTTDGYTTNFFDTGLSAGSNYTYTVTATGSGGIVSAASAPLSASTGSTTTPITSCGTISSSGSYVLPSSLSSSLKTTCLTIQNTTNVTLDCQGNTISMASGVTPPTTFILINNVQNFMLVNCTITPNAKVYNLSVQNSSSGFIDGDSFTGSDGFVSVNASNALVVSNNTFTNSLYEQGGSSGNYIGNNQISYSNYVGAQLIGSGNGSANTIDNNNVNGNGGWTAATGNYGFDDGIGIGMESNDILANNTIQNVWDTGIETDGLISNCLFANNTINYARISGIGGWYYNSWTGNTVSNNKISNVEMTFYFFNQAGLPTGQTKLYFLNNTFIGNVSTSPVSSYIGGPSTFIDMDPADNPSIPAGSLIAGNNVFTDNVWASNQYAPTLWPANMIVDGGGNVCGAESYNKNSQLTCVN